MDTPNHSYIGNRNTRTFYCMGFDSLWVMVIKYIVSMSEETAEKVGFCSSGGIHLQGHYLHHEYISIHYVNDPIWQQLLVFPMITNCRPMLSTFSSDEVRCHSAGKYLLIRAQCSNPRKAFSREVESVIIIENMLYFIYFTKQLLPLS